MIELTFLKEPILIKQVHQKCDICHYLYFLSKGFKCHPNVCSRCHDLLMMFMNLGDIAILKIKGSDHCCIIKRTSKSEAINLTQKIYLTNKVKHYKRINIKSNFEAVHLLQILI